MTSIGRDGEEHDVIDRRIAKPRVRLVAGSLVATTDALLRASAIAHERLLATGIRTPLGEVLLARLHAEGTIEVAGPSAAEDVRRVAQEMIAPRGAADPDRRCDRPSRGKLAGRAQGLVMATGAVLGEEIERVVEVTAAAVELVRLPRVAAGVLESEPLQLGRGLVLDSDPDQIAAALREHPRASVLGRLRGAQRALPRGPPGRSSRARRARASPRGRRPDEGLPIAPPTRLV